MARRAANGGLAATAVMTVTSAGGALAIPTKKTKKTNRCVMGGEERVGVSFRNFALLCSERRGKRRRGELEEGVV